MLKNLLRSKTFVTFLLMGNSLCAFLAAANQKILTISIRFWSQLSISFRFHQRRLS